MRYAKVIVPAVALLFAASALMGATCPENIIDTAARQGNLKTFLCAVKAAGLECDLRGPGPYTVFAPSDAAFAKIGKCDLDALLSCDNKDKLKAILLYHAIDGRVTACDVLGMTSPTMVTTLAGSKLKITHCGDQVIVNNARVTCADIVASNGVIHVIDTVLMPPEK